MSPLEKISKLTKPRYSYNRRKTERVVEGTVKQLRKVQWRYKSVLMLVGSLLAAYFIINGPALDPVVEKVGDLGYVGAILTGFLHSFSLTIIPATAIFFRLGGVLNPVLLALLGALGSVAGDFFIFRFVKNNLVEELQLLGDNVGGKVAYHGAPIFNSEIMRKGVSENSIFYRIFPFSNLLLSDNFRRTMVKISYSKAWKRSMLLLSGLMIALPFPNELGVAFVGMTDMDTKQSLIFFYIVSFLGILTFSYLGMKI
jgi:hypothetical protein